MADFLLLVDIKALGLGEHVNLMKSSAIRSNSANKKLGFEFYKVVKGPTLKFLKLFYKPARHMFLKSFMSEKKFSKKRLVSFVFWGK